MTLWRSKEFWALSSGLFLNAYIYGMAASQSVLLGSHTFVLLAWSPLWLASGIFLGGTIADRVGRLRLLMWTPAAYLIGSAFILLWPTVHGLLVGSGILLLTGGIESNTLLTYAQELMPEKIKRRAMYLELNFVNFGGLVLSGVVLLTPTLPDILQHRGLSAVPIVLSIFSWAMRKQLHESPSWLGRSKSHPAARCALLKYLPRLLTAMAFSLSNTAGFSLLTYGYGALFFPHSLRYFLIVNSLTATFVGFSAPWVARYPANRVLMSSYFLAALTATGLTFVYDPSMRGFWPLIILLSSATSISYLAEDTFKSGAWPPSYRARFTATSRITGLLGYLLIITIIHRHILHVFVITIAVVWWFGFLAAGAWRAFGRWGRPGDEIP